LNAKRPLPWQQLTPADFPVPLEDTPLRTGPDESIVLGGGCFWCVEAVFREIDGVTGLVSGYAGGTEETADYRTVCGGGTDHAEVVEVRYDPARTTLGAILRVFFSIAHDPTQLNRQGNDRGRQYRSAIFFRDADQERVVRAYVAQLESARILNAPIVTEIVPLEAFYPGEEYHQDYARRNPGQPYVAFVAAPKAAKARRYFPRGS
jgi:peptide-methionine (S)-S-oxide reductase